MKKKFSFWIINFSLTAVISFLLNAGMFADTAKTISPSKGRVGAIKLAGKNSSIPMGWNSSLVRHQLPKNLEQDTRTRAQ